MIHSIILDDNIKDCQLLDNLIHQYSSSFETKVFYRAKDCLTYLSSHLVDVLFLDIKLEDKYSFEVFDFVKTLPNSPLIVYVSDYPKYAKQCIGYKVIKFIEKKELQEDLEDTLKEIEKYFEYKLKSFTYVIKSITYSIPYTHIVSFIRDGNYVDFTYVENGNYKSEYILTSISKLEEQLDHQFIKINQGMIMNSLFIKEIDGHHVEMKQGSVYPISRSQRKEVIKKYHQIMMKKRIVD